MSFTTTPAVTLADLSFSWPDGSPVLEGLTATFTVGRTGLIGNNGTGKNTLLRLIAGHLTPTSGSVSVTGEVGWLPQHLTLRTDAAVADLLGVSGRLGALRAIESGDADPRHFETLADDWEVEARSLAALDRIGLADIELDRPVGTLPARPCWRHWSASNWPQTTSSCSTSPPTISTATPGDSCTRPSSRGGAH